MNDTIENIKGTRGLGPSPSLAISRQTVWDGQLSLGMNGESTRCQCVIKVAYIGVLIHSSACNKDRAARGCWEKWQVSWRLGEALH